MNDLTQDAGLPDVHHFTVLSPSVDTGTERSRVLDDQSAEWAEGGGPVVDVECLRSHFAGAEPDCLEVLFGRDSPSVAQQSGFR